ncbi:MAG: choice-of-anchor Q domain-containing protein [bacterium]
MSKKIAFASSFVVGLMIALETLTTCSGPQIEAAEVQVNPGQSIQAAIDAAADLDLIIVHQGTYHENITFMGKAITVRSTDPENPDIIAATIIDGSRSGSVITFDQEEGVNSVLAGITVQNGQAEHGGGGVLCKESSPSIINCIIKENAAGHGGGGICCMESSAVITHCVVEKNAAGHGGGGICCKESSISITGCLIFENSAGHCGGGILCKEAQPAITDCLIHNNKAERCGGGILCKESSPTISRCTISDNSAQRGGGGIGCESDSSPVIINCLMNRNSADKGGAISCTENSAPVAINCTISENSANSSGGGLYSHESTPSVTNCILWANSPAEIYVQSGTPAVTYSDIQDGYAGLGNIHADPRFVDSAAGDYHLKAGSPCIDTGLNTDVPAEDKDGTPRPQDGDGDGTATYDMGAYEYVAPVRQ